MTDQQLIDAAKAAGLCFPSCWSLEDSEEDADDDLAWVQGAPNGKEMMERQALVDAANRRRDEQMTRLRTFAASIRALPEAS